MLPVGGSPILGLSPVTQRIFLIPIAFTPITADCRPVLVVSRAAICKTGSALRPMATLQQAILDIFGRAEDESVKLIAVTKGLTNSMPLISLSVLALSGGVTSVATTNSPSRNRLSKEETGSSL